MRSSIKRSMTGKQQMSPRGVSANAGHRNPSEVSAVSQVTACVPEVAAAAREPARLITKRQLSQIVPYTSQHILRLEKKGKFPRRIQVGANRVAWLLSEVEAWVAARVAERDSFIR